MASLSREQRRRNIEEALSRVRESRGGTTGGVSGGASVKGFVPKSKPGTVLVVDPAAGRTQAVEATPENLKIIERGRQRTIALRQQAGQTKPTTAQEFQQSLFRKQGFNVSVDKSGVLIAQKGDKRVIVSDTGRSVTVPTGAKVNISQLSTVSRQQQRGRLKSFQEKEAAKKKVNVESRLGKGQAERIKRTKELRASLAERFKGTENISSFSNFITGGTLLKSSDKSVIGKVLNVRQRIRSSTVSGLIGWPFYLIREVPAATAETLAVAESFINTKTRKSQIQKIIPTAIRTAKETFTSPEFYGGLLSAVAIAGISGGLSNPTKPTLTKIENSLKTKISKAKNPAIKSNLQRALNSVKKLKANTKFVNKLDNSIKTTKASKSRLANEIIRKIETNNKNLQGLKQLKQKTSKVLKTKKRGTGDLSKANRAAQLKKINSKIKSIQNSNKSLNTKLLKTKASPQTRARLRSQIKKELAGKVKSPKLKTKTKATATIKLKPEVKAKIDYAKSFVTKPTMKVINSTRISLKKAGYTVRIVAGKKVKPLTKAAKVVLGKAKNTIIKTGTISKAMLLKVRQTLIKFNLEVIRIARKAKVETVKVSKVAINKSLSTIKKTYKPIVKKITRTGNTIKIYLKGTENILSRKFTEALNALNKKLPVEIKIKLVTKSGRTRTWPLRSKRISIKKRPSSKPQLPSSVSKIIKKIRRGNTKKFKRLTDIQIAKKILSGKIKLTSKTNKFIRKALRKTFRKDIRLKTSSKRFSKIKAEKDVLVKRFKAEKKARSDKVKSEIMVQELRRKQSLDNIQKAQQQAQKLLMRIKNETLRKFPTKKTTSRSRTRTRPKTTKGQSKPKQPKEQFREVVTSDGQVLLQKVKDIQKDIVKISKTKNPTKAKQQAKGVANKIKANNQLLKNKIRNAKKTPLTTTYISLVSAITIALSNNLKRSIKTRSKNIGRQGIAAVPKTESKAKTKSTTTTKRKVTQKPKDDTVIKTQTIPEVRIDTKTKTQQLQIITQVLGSLAVAQAFRVRGRRVNKKQTRLRGGVSKARKFIFNQLQRKRRAFTPDIYSLVFGIKAKKGEKIQLLRPGRVFTGIERRAIVR